MPSEHHLWEMLQFLDGLFPSGTFAHSFGLETIVQEGWVSGEDCWMEYLREVLEDSWAWTDALAATQVWRGHDNALVEEVAFIDGVLSASRASQESREGSLLTGRRILQEAAALLDSRELQAYRNLTRVYKELGNAAVIIALLGRVRGWGERATLTGYAYFSLSGMVQALVRLIPLGQSAGQRMLHHLRPVAFTALQAVQNTTLDDLCNHMTMWEIAGMRHQGLYSRLFRS